MIEEVAYADLGLAMGRNIRVFPFIDNTVVQNGNPLEDDCPTLCKYQETSSALHPNVG